MDGKEAVRAHTLATSIFRHLASLQNEIPPLRAPQQSAREPNLRTGRNLENNWFFSCLRWVVVVLIMGVEGFGCCSRSCQSSIVSIFVGWGGLFKLTDTDSEDELLLFLL